MKEDYPGPKEIKGDKFKGDNYLCEKAYPFLFYLQF